MHHCIGIVGIERHRHGVAETGCDEGVNLGEEAVFGAEMVHNQPGSDAGGVGDTANCGALGSTSGNDVEGRGEELVTTGGSRRQVSHESGCGLSRWGKSTIECR